MCRWLLSVLALIGGILLWLPTGADAREAGVEINYLDSSTYPLVTIGAPVVDAAGNAVLGLTQDNFTVTENGEPARIVSVKTAVDSDVGAGVVLVIDVSGSMRGVPLQSAKTAARDFIDGLAPADLIAIATFADSVQLVQTFTADRGAAKAVIDSLVAAGDTALYDGASQGIDFAAQSGLQRQAIVLLSDGANDPPERPPLAQDVLDEASGAAIPVFSVTLGSGADTTFSEQLAEASGGAAFAASDPSQLPGLYGAVSQRLNSEYVIEYEGTPDVGLQQVVLGVNSDQGQFSASTEFDILSLSSGDGPMPTLAGVEPGAAINSERVLEPAVDGEVASFQVTVDGVAQETNPEPPYEYTFQPAALTPGRHEIAFEATGPDGKVGRYDLVVEVAEVAPVVVISGADGAAVAEGSQLTFEVLSQGRAIDSLVVSVGGEEFTLSEPPYVLALPDTLSAGANEVTATTTVAGEEATASSSVEFVPPTASPSILPFVAAAGAIAMVAGLGYLLFKRHKQRAARKPEEYVPGARDSYEPMASGTTFAPVDGPPMLIEPGRGPKARLRAIAGPAKGKTYFLGNGSAVIGTAPEATVQITLPGWETAPELIRIWARDDKYMFHQVAPGPVSIAGREIQWAILESGDEIRIHEHVFLFEVPEAARASFGAGQNAPAQA